MDTTSTKRPIIHEAMRIGGEKVDTTDRVEVRYPYTDEVIGTVPAGTAEHAAQAFDIAKAYKAKLSRYERQQILLRTAELIRARRESIAEVLTLELGICHQHALYETGRAYDVFTFAGQLSILDDGQIFSCDLTPNGKERKIYTKREPVGAISAITPFNHPLNMVSHKIAPAIATNNCMVCKPTELTPLTAITLADILYEAGLPPEMFQIVTGMPQDIGDEMITNDNIDIITFTGGVKVGKIIADKLTEHAAGIQRQSSRFNHKMQGCQSTARSYRQQESRPANRQYVHVDTAAGTAAAEHQPAAESDHERKQVSEVAKQIQEDIRKPGTDQATEILDKVGGATVRPAGILRVITHERQQQVCCQR